MKRQGHVVDWVDDYLHGVLSTDDAAYVQSHVESCRICQLALEEARQRVEALQAVPIIEASEDVIQNTMQRVAAVDRSQRRVRRTVGYTWSLAMAASIAIIGGLHLYYLSLSPSQYDLQVYGQNSLLAGTAGSLRVRLVDHNTQRALSGVPVRVELRDRQGKNAVQLASFKTDANGSGDPRIELPDLPDGDYQLTVRAQTPGTDEILTRNVKLIRSWKLMLSTDKPVYQPGQVIHMRSLALRRPDLRPVAGQELTFSVTDPKGNVIFKQRGASSSYGISSADCPLATEILEGTYTIGCIVGDTESRVAVEIKPYVLPKFRIDVDVDQPYYQPGETVQGTVQADYFFGKAVASGSVEVAVFTSDVARVELDRIKTTTDITGRAEFTLRAAESLFAREQDGGDASITFEVTVRDTAGQEQSRTISRNVTVNPIRLEIIAESGELVRDVTNLIYVFATYADGRPARVRLAISGLDHEVSTSDLGAASFELKPGTNQVDLVVRATDSQGLVGRAHRTLSVGQVSQDFVLRTDRAVYEGGDTINLTALGAGVEPVFVDFIKDGQTILTESVTMINGRGQHAFDLPPELFGTIEVVGYRFGASGIPLRKRQVIYVSRADELNITAELDRNEYRPGERAQLVLHLSGDNGQAVPGAISLAAVDEAVFAVLEQAPGMEKTFFNLEQELLQPVYAIYNWTPSLDTSQSDPQDRNRFEQALFARTAGEVRSSDAIFQKLLESGDVTPRQLQVLNDPNLDELMERVSLPDAVVQAIRGGGSPHSLSATSYPAKRQQIEATKSRGLDDIRGAWKLFALAAAVSGMVVLSILVHRNWFVVLVVLSGLSLAVSIFLPSLSRARELSKRLVAASNLKGIGTAMQIAGLNGSIRTNSPSSTESQPIRVREWFPETLLWRPELITDDDGRVTIDVDLADSITTWRLTASAVAGDGRLGALDSAIRVFQPFFVDLNLPVALTRGDEVAMPAVVYNYLDQTQTVEISLDTQADWFDLLDEPVKRIELAPGEVRSTSFRIHAKRVGQYDLQVTARSGGVGDAIKRKVEVVPDGQEVAQVFNGTLSQPIDLTLVVPPNAIEGSVRAVLKLYPSTFSQVMEGLEGIFQQPYGCFEQTSSTTYPNVLALDYLRQTQQNAPDVEAKARQYIHLGYQRLLGFEVDGGGFDWFGRQPANRTLTAYGLMEFEDMARVHDVDPKVIDRTRDWLLDQRNSDGSWSPESHKMHIDPTIQTDDARLTTTAYIAWAVFSGNADESLGHATRKYLLSHSAQSLDDPYVLALVCNALLAMRDNDPAARPYLARLVTLRKFSPNDDQVWWQRAAGRRTTFYGAGLSGDIETTAISTLALLKARHDPQAARKALTWLVARKDRLGTWHSTQATVLAFKALLAGTGQPLDDNQQRVIQYAIGEGERRHLRISADQSDVMQVVELGSELQTGANRLALSQQSGSGIGYQLDFRYHVPEDGGQRQDEPLTIDLHYDRSKLSVGDSVAVSANVRNNMPTAAPMVILDLPIPAGFAAEAESFDTLVKQGVVAKYQVTPRSVVVYLRQIEPSKPLSLSYRLQATMPVRVTVPGALVYEYYDPDRKATSKSAVLEVVAANGT